MWYQNDCRHKSGILCTFPLFSRETLDKKKTNRLHILLILHRSNFGFFPLLQRIVCWLLKGLPACDNKKKLRIVPANNNYMASHVCKRNTYHFNSVDLDVVSNNSANKLSIPLHLWVIWKGTV